MTGAHFCLILRIGNRLPAEDNIRQVVLYQDEDGYWIADVPSLPGCHSDGATPEEALKNVQEAIQVYIEALTKDGLPVPEDPRTAQLVIV